MSSTSDTIGILSWDYAAPKGGMGISIKRIAEQLRGAGRTVHVLSPASDSNNKPFLPVTRRFGGHIFFSCLLPFSLDAVLRQMSARLLMIPVGPGGVFLLRRSPVPLVAIVYHMYLQQVRSVPGQWWKKVFLPFERRTLRAASHVFCYCADTFRILTTEYGLTNVVIQLPHAVELREKASQKNDAHVVCVSRLEARKGVDVLLKAWPDISARVPHARLTIVGKGRDETRVDRLMNGLRNVSRVHDLPRAELDALVARATAAACPAYLEGFGLAAAEAMSAGTVVVASDVDGLRSLIIHEHTGILVPAGDSAALADAIVRALTDEKLRLRLANAAHEKIRMEHDPPACARAIVDAVAALA